MLTNYENMLYGMLGTVQEELNKAISLNNYLEDCVKKAKEAEDRWYRYYCEKKEELGSLQKELNSLNEQKKEQDAATSDSSDNLNKEAI